MTKYGHRKLADTIRDLDKRPDDDLAFNEWIKAGPHVAFLESNALEPQVVVYGSGEYSFVHAVAAPEKKIVSADPKELLNWSFNPFISAASYVTGGGGNDVWVDRQKPWTGTTALAGATLLVYGRVFEGWTGPGASYFELSQEFAHLADLHWRPEQKAYCRFDNNGDLDPVVIITDPDHSAGAPGLISFAWEPIEEYLSASRCCLVRMFDFTLLRRDSFHGWPEIEPEYVEESGDLFYRRGVVPGVGGYTRGVQVIRPRAQRRVVLSRITRRWSGTEPGDYVEFIAHDWRNRRVTRISTDPRATTNYFEAKNNSLPFELSAAFFRPEVLLKYKADRDKYTVGDRDVSCRASWRLEAFDINEAGQIHAYICYLRRLPYSEQLHWASFNEAPKAGISDRAVTNDFEGNWTQHVEPHRAVLAMARRWHQERVGWWRLRDEQLLERVNQPVSASRDEWAEAILELSKLLVEGFETKAIRRRLNDLSVEYDTTDRSIHLLEKLVAAVNGDAGDVRLEGLRSIQLIRSKVKGHAAGSEAAQLAHDALEQFETYRNHFQHLCEAALTDLEAIESSFSQ